MMGRGDSLHSRAEWAQAGGRQDGEGSMDRLQAMTTFVRVVENGSFSGAARQLAIEGARILRRLHHDSHNQQPEEGSFFARWR